MSDFFYPSLKTPFLYADPTPSALQVFSSRPQAVALADTSQTVQVGSEKGVWINADPIPGCVVCNIGEMWEIWTNGLYRSTLHQVVHRSSNYRHIKEVLVLTTPRVSIPFFFEPNFNADVRPLAAALRLQKSEDRQEQRKPMIYGEFLMKKVGNNFADGKGKYD
ncbi:hypothetical protein C0995_000134 [Termitomyces sp. Mi166|nr:hypothetical protein C0995_000134 [Termitomyces sp. Mi166\